ncbi:hypothetical protein PTSG_02917 [Salpingoeca rosetta]|uniref:Carboxylesterase type B domain-containing protein n=1 Tax=Salpingoeca rosetta (strain ATCC 50818 / BSB-021) TaxID=946362 RepID=F2U3Q3_SALR5|nr:uncharacterized protein PTSG_02917 [Salpingoeca rosetta]EGD82247.1 hypothetical protein PTSG_02917 [Salpingoeca rosetta]|eukprot:XP_004996430.1 hypothetical protein PTSG_02917 [Salpingoeca rosetta]
MDNSGLSGSRAQSDSQFREWPPLVHDFDEKERRMAETFGLYWSNMARYGDPNHNLGPDQATWPAYTPAYRSWASMTVPVAINTQLEKAKCDFWQSRYTKYYFDGM